MARKKLSEFTAKSLLLKTLDIPYSGISISSDDTLKFSDRENTLYIVKVDQGVKGRMKKGLVKLKVALNDIPEAIESLRQKGYERFLIEEFLSHEASQEKYISIERTREGKVVYFSNKGGIDIEENRESVKRVVIPSEESWEERINTIIQYLQIDKILFRKILNFFDEEYISFLEINPFIIHNSTFLILDLAVEVDSAAEFFVQNGWTSGDFVEDELVGEKTPEEKNILALKAKSQAAFTLTILNPDGSIWLLLSGGGASIVLADEAYNQGRGQDVANYGEYSGNPNEEETYIYTKNLLHLLLKSPALKKVLIIGGGVANFTDIKVTFRGVIQALDEFKEQLSVQNVQVFVRRGGPHQEEGLASMREFLEKADIFGGVWDQSMVLPDVISKAIDYLNE